MADDIDLTGLTADIVAAHVSNNTTSVADLPALISTVYKALSTASSGAVAEPPAPELKPAVSIRKSITPDHLISLEDGKPYKSLKRHLAKHGLTPPEYRAKWGLPKDYPMVAASYAAQRSELAKKIGLGQGGRGRPPVAPPAPVETKPTRGRKPKA